jgi:putative sigma-54 modulation protein
MARGVNTDPERREWGSVMELQIRTNGTKVTNGMREFIDRRMSKLDRLADKIVDAQLELRTETPRTGPATTTAQLTLHTGNHILRSEERADDPSKAVDAAIDKLIVQVRKYNDKKKARRRRAGEHPMTQMVTDEETAALDIEGIELPASENGHVPDIEDEEDDEEEAASLRVKRFAVKPMIIDEAVDQMELLGHDFFLFHNADEDQLNVVYKRRDGAYGLLAPSKA